MQKVAIIFEAGFEGIGVSPKILQRHNQSYGHECQLEFQGIRPLLSRMVPIPVKYHHREVILLSDSWKRLYNIKNQVGLLTFPTLSFIDKISFQQLSDGEVKLLPLITDTLNEKGVYFKGQYVVDNGHFFLVEEVASDRTAGVFTYTTNVRVIPPSIDEKPDKKSGKKSTGADPDPNIPVIGGGHAIENGLPTVDMKETKKLKGPPDGLKSIKGIDNTLDQIWAEVIYPFKANLKLKKKNKSKIGGVMLYGPPGVGKTALAKAIATELNLPFLRLDISDFSSPYAHQAAKLISKKFEEAAKHEDGAVLFVDEIDTIAGKREGMLMHDRENVNALLQELDPAKKSPNVLIVAGTNYLNELDPAILRSGRFDTKIGLPPPDKHGRFEILSMFLAPLERDQKEITIGYLKEVASRIVGFVGADIETFVHKAIHYKAQRIRNDQNTDIQKDLITKADMEAALDGITPLCELLLDITVPTIDMDSLYGVDEIFEKLELEINFTVKPEMFRDDLPKVPSDGILLYGPAGTGKSSIANALAKQLNLLFMNVNAESLTDKYVGETKKNIVNLFEKARLFRPILLFFDEIDSIGSQRISGTEAHHNDSTTALLTQLSGVNDNSGVLVMGATNHIEALDPALIRPGRFGIHIEVGLPNNEQYEAIWNGYISKIPHTFSQEGTKHVIDYFSTHNYSQSQVTDFYYRVVKYLYANTKQGEPATDRVLTKLMEASHVE